MFMREMMRITRIGFDPASAGSRCITVSLEVVAHADENLVKGDLWAPAKQRVNALGVRHAALHVFEAGGIRFGVRDVNDLGRAVNNCLDSLRELADCHLFVTADIERSSRGGGMIGEPDDRSHRVVDVAEAASLGAVTEDGDWLPA